MEAKWKSSTLMIFWSVILITFAGFFASIFDLIDLIQTASTLVSGARNGLFDFGIPIPVDAFKLITFIGWILYLVGLTKFYKIHKLEETRNSFKKVRSAAILSIVAIIVCAIFGVLPGLGYLLNFIFMLVVYNKMKNAYSHLAIAADLNDMAHKAADNLRSSAIFNIRALWTPVVLSICAVVMVFTILMMASSSYHSGIGKALGSVLAVIVFLGVLCLVAVLVYLFIAICFNIIGWYRMYKGGAVSEVSNEDKEIIDEVVEQEPVEVESSSVEQEVESEQNEKVDVSATSRTWHNKKTGMIAGGVMVLVLTVLGISKCGGTENHFEVKVPTWEKFIMVTAEDVNLRKEPNVNSDKLMVEDLSVPETDMIGYRQFWSDMKSTRYIYPFHLEKDFSVCPVISETDEWYQIYVYNEYWSKAETAYIMKKFCKEVAPDVLDKETVTSINNSRFGVYYAFPSSGKYKGYCVQAIPEGMDILPELKIGKIVDNVIVYPAFEDDVLVRLYDGDDATVDFVQDESYNASFSEKYMLEYGCVNPKKLDEKQIDRLFGTVVKGKQGSLVSLEYCFNGEIKYFLIDLNGYKHQLTTK